MGLSENRSGFSLLDRDPSRYSKLKALVVDDVQENRDVLSKMLTSIGVETLEAKNGREGVKKTIENQCVIGE